MTVKLLTEHRLEFLSVNGGCTGSSESTLVKIPHCSRLIKYDIHFIGVQPHEMYIIYNYNMDFKQFIFNHIVISFLKSDLQTGVRTE